MMQIDEADIWQGAPADVFTYGVPASRLQFLDSDLRIIIPPPPQSADSAVIGRPAGVNSRAGGGHV
ncbi:MAG: hypothetical protein LBP37_04405 [Spirochaetaceae bacterium]|nr:hypothetical protein [Spirochaetaceae bacterium]